MKREDADHQLTQFADVHIEVAADRLVSVEPFLPNDIQIDCPGDGTCIIHGKYGLDLFTDHRFVFRIGRELVVVHRLEDIPDPFDNVVEFLPDSTHDITISYTFEKDGQSFVHSHWIHHDTGPWEPILHELISRETNGGYGHARSHTHRRHGHVPLLTDDPDGRIP